MRCSPSCISCPNTAGSGATRPADSWRPPRWDLPRRATSYPSRAPFCSSRWACCRRRSPANRVPPSSSTRLAGKSPRTSWTALPPCSGSPSTPAPMRREASAIIDTAGRAELTSVEVLSTPDSGLIAPLKQWMLASQFSPGRLKGAAVRVMVQLAVGVHPPRLAATDLVTQARSQLAAGRSDSALSLLDLALDTALTHPTDGERAYALLVRGLVGRSSRDSAARVDLRDGLALYQDLRARGIDLAPFVRRLADSVRASGPKPKRPRADMPAPTAVSAVDEQPVLLSHPPIHYPPELAALKVDGTVVVEAALDLTGHVEPASPRLVQSPNHGFDAEALRVVRGSVYRPARSNGQPARAVIRQAISFVSY